MTIKTTTSTLDGSGTAPNLHLRRWTTADSTPSSAFRSALIWTHGIGEHSGRVGELAETLLSRVPSLDAVFCADMRNHGESDGAPGAVRSIGDLESDLLSRVIPAALAQCAPDASIVLGGHSLGGLVTACACALPWGNAKCVVRGVVLSAPAVKVAVNGVVNRVLAPLAQYVVRIGALRTVTKGSGISGEMLTHDEEGIRAYNREEGLVHRSISFGLAADFLTRGNALLNNVEKADGRVLLKRDDVKVLMFHGTEDSVADISGTKRLAHIIGESERVQMVEVQGSRHEMHKEKDDLGKREFYDTLCKFMQSVLT